MGGWIFGVLANSKNGYIGKGAASDTSKKGLGYDVVMKLMQPYLGQGYHLHLDNFYTSTQLVKDLFSHATPSTTHSSFLTTLYSANEQVSCQRKMK